MLNSSLLARSNVPAKVQTNENRKAAVVQMGESLVRSLPATVASLCTSLTKLMVSGNKGLAIEKKISIL